MLEDEYNRSAYEIAETAKSYLDPDRLEHYLETGEIEDEAVRTLIRERKLFPCCFGSALKMQGVEEFLQVFDTFTTAPSMSKG